jgi:hypothetical protein
VSIVEKADELARLLDSIFNKPESERNAILMVASEKVDSSIAAKMLKSPSTKDDDNGRWGS